MKGIADAQRCGDVFFVNSPGHQWWEGAAVPSHSLRLWLSVWDGSEVLSSELEVNLATYDSQQFGNWK